MSLRGYNIHIIAENMLKLDCFLKSLKAISMDYKSISQIPALLKTNGTHLQKSLGLNYSFDGSETKYGKSSSQKISLNKELTYFPSSDISEKTIAMQQHCKSFNKRTYQAKRLFKRILLKLELKKLFVRKRANRPCCVTHPTTCIMPTAKIYNHMNDKKSIKIGEYSYILGELLLFGHGGQISIGDYCYVGEGSRIWSAKQIKIGNRVLISHNVNIFDNNTHPIDDFGLRHEQFKHIITNGHPKAIFLDEHEVIIEDDVLVGCQSIILAGIHIGKGAVIAAGSVVTKDVAPMTLVAGNPAKMIRILKK